MLAGWLLPAPWLAQRQEEPGFSLLCGLGLSSSASDSWLQSGRQCVQFYSSRCEIFFVMLSWKVKKLGWLLCHSPWSNRGLSTKDAESMCLCILLVCGQHLCAVSCLYCGTSAPPEEQGPNQCASTAPATVRSAAPILGHWKQKEAPVLTRSCLSGSCPASSASKDKRIKAAETPMISTQDFCREFSYSKNEEMSLKIFQFSRKWDSWKETFHLKIVLLTVHFSTGNQHWQEPIQASHIPGSVCPFCCLDEPPHWKCQVLSVGSVLARLGMLGRWSSASSPLPIPEGQSRATCEEAALGHREVLYHSAILHNCCLPTDKSSPLCPCAQQKAFQIACTVNFISITGLLVPLPTQNEQPDSRKRIRRRARSSASQQPVLCKQPLPELCQSTSIHCREDVLMLQTDTWDQTALIYFIICQREVENVW